MLQNYGYRYDLEVIGEIRRTASPIPTLLFDAPEEIDPRPWHRIENQGSIGSCQGHALSSVCEFAYHIALGEVIQFSPMWCYLKTQMLDGLLGSDSGSTIDGGRKCAQQFGVCTLEKFPYPNPVRYSTKIPDGAAEDASKYKIRSHFLMTTYDEIFSFIASGQGGVEIGIAWGNNTITDSQGIMENYSPGGGGHAVCFLGYSKRKDNKNRNYLWLANSWGISSWGKQGWAEVAPYAVEQMLQHRYTVMIGLSDLSTPKVRKVDWSANSVFKGKTK